MRKQLAMFAIVSVVATTSTWPLFAVGNLQFDGSLEVSGNSANNEKDLGGVKTSNTGSNDHRGVTTTRVRVGMNAEVTEGVTGRLELVRNNGSAGSQSLYGGAGKPSSVSNEESNFLFHNAYVTLQDLWGMEARLGRQYTGEVGDAIWHIGPKSDDALAVNSIDGLQLQCAKKEPRGNFWDKLHVVLFTGKAAETATSVAQTDATSSGDVNLTNVEAILSVIPGGRVRTAVLMGDKSNTSGAGDNDHLKIFRLGANGGIHENMFTYRAEYLKNFGQRNNGGATSDLKYKGSAIDLGAGFNSGDLSIGSIGVALNFFQASGDDKTANDNDDKSFHDFSLLGVNTSDRYFGEIFGKSNALGGGTPLGQGVDGVNSTAQSQGLQVFNVGLVYKPHFSTKSRFDLQFYTFSRAKGSVDGTDHGKKFGNEFDLTYGYDHTENVGLELGWAMLNPDEALDYNVAPTTGLNATQQDAINKIFARAKIKFGGEKS